MRYARFLIIAALLASAAHAADDADTCADHQGEASLAACSRLIDSGSARGSDLARLHALRGTAYRNAGDYAHAAADFTIMIDLLRATAPSDVVASAYVVRAATYALMGDSANALADYRAALALNPSNEQASEGARRIEAALATPSSTAANGTPAQPPPADRRAATPAQHHPSPPARPAATSKCFTFNGERFCQ